MVLIDVCCGIENVMLFFYIVLIIIVLVDKWYKYMKGDNKYM